MRLLLVTATEPEIAPLIKELKFLGQVNSQLRNYTHKNCRIDVLITGVGMVATAAWTSRILAQEKYDGAINAGICGSFDRKIALGDVVEIQTDCMPELGAEDDQKFIDIHDLNLLPKDEFPFSNGVLSGSEAALFGTLLKLQKVSGITVNRVHGNENTIAQIVSRLNPQVESMEGAAFLYACAIGNVPAIQVRSVSNYVEKRNRNAWKIGEAVRNLNAELLKYLNEK
jgi:futalosine hydrolase